MKVTTPVGELDLPDSHRIGTQTKCFTHVGKQDILVAVVRWGASDKGGHAYFSVTGNLYEHAYIREMPAADAIQWTTRGSELVPVGYRLFACGCLHDVIAERIPELAPALAYHLVSTKGPMHYFANTIYLAGDRDPCGYVKGEQRRNKDGLPYWQLSYDVAKELGLSTIVARAEAPHPTATPWLMEGKDRELDAARRTAVWPDASDEELSLPVEELQKRLHDRLPQLMASFQKVVSEVGFQY